ncbi:MAG: hypothetical protein R3E02_11730 [Blastomonas sp.]
MADIELTSSAIANLVEIDESSLVEFAENASKVFIVTILHHARDTKAILGRASR